ncbi:MAG: Cof-type HAD-IIB family hydrolase [Spirochaetaceae bacterium]|jgi:Cof subfamily protein (haloacid dehalogenase superfamily)|nr:Cof-type HAD-IIB family hydrolase [Spirochaetaceae bacterium]
MRTEPSPASIKAVALDLDGTLLLPGGILSGRAALALKRCLSWGVRVILATGRSAESAEPYRQSIGAEGPMVYFNGAQVLKMPSAEVVSEELLDPEVVLYAADIARRKGLYFQAYIPQKPALLITEAYTQEAELYRKHTGIRPAVGDIKQAATAPGIAGCVKCMFITDAGFHEEIRAELLERFGPRIYVVRSSPEFLEVLRAGVSKGQGLARALDCYGLESSQVIAFGDEENDLPLLRSAGFAVAPANAKEEVRLAADKIVPANSEDGVAAFLEAFFT